MSLQQKSTKPEQKNKEKNIIFQLLTLEKEIIKKTRELNAASWIRIKNDPERKEKKNKFDRDRSKVCRETLSDNYVIARVIGKKGKGLLFKKDIPQELVELKRKQLILKRQIL